jgi:hypothetical protein
MAAPPSTPSSARSSASAAAYCRDPRPDRKLLLKSFAGDDEKELLLNFYDLLHKWGSEGPEISLRPQRQGLRLSLSLPPHDHPRDETSFGAESFRQKPWEVPHIDTMELWKFGEYKSFISLNLLAHTLGIPTPKDDIDGSQVGDVYWSQRDLPRIVTYCQKDVITVAQVYLRCMARRLSGRKT